MLMILRPQRSIRHAPCWSVGLKVTAGPPAVAIPWGGAVRVPGPRPDSGLECGMHCRILTRAGPGGRVWCEVPWVMQCGLGICSIARASKIRAGCSVGYGNIFGPDCPWGNNEIGDSPGHPEHNASSLRRDPGHRAWVPGLYA